MCRIVTVIDSRYGLIREIGSGATGRVFIAEDGLLKRIVAIKLYTKSDRASMRYFDSETRAVTKLSHPNIVEVYDIVNRDKYKYIVMEYVNGITLSEYIDTHGKLSVGETVSCTLQILSALADAHRNGIVHRDIKPENIMIDKNGRVKLTDFGIAKTSGIDSFKNSQKGIGSVYYISPEQARGALTDNRSDIYSLGVVMYEMLTGHVPFDADTTQRVAMMHITDMPASLCEHDESIPPRLEKIIFKAMQKDPAMRYQDARSMQSAILGTDGKTKKRFMGKKMGGVVSSALLCGIALAAFIAIIVFILK